MITMFKEKVCYENWCDTCPQRKECEERIERLDFKLNLIGCDKKIEMRVKKEEKYLVIKLEDLENYFSQFTKGVFTTEDEQDHINYLTWGEVLRAVKNDNKYIVCNQDESYAEEVWQTILKGEDAKLKQRD